MDITATLTSSFSVEVGSGKFENYGWAVAVKDNSLTGLVTCFSCSTSKSSETKLLFPNFSDVGVNCSKGLPWVEVLTGLSKEGISMKVFIKY